MKRHLFKSVLTPYGHKHMVVGTRLVCYIFWRTVCRLVRSRPIASPTSHLFFLFFSFKIQRTEAFGPIFTKTANSTKRNNTKPNRTRLNQTATLHMQSFAKIQKRIQVPPFARADCRKRKPHKTWNLRLSLVYIHIYVTRECGNGGHGRYRFGTCFQPYA